MTLRKEHWVMPLVFLVVSLPVLLTLQAAQWGGEFKLLVAIVAGGLAASFAQHVLRRREQEGQQ